MVKMLHIPFRYLSDEIINEKTLILLQKEYYLPKYLFKYLLGKRFDYPGQLLKDIELLKNSKPEDFIKLVVPPHSNLGFYNLHFNVEKTEILKDQDSGIMIQLIYISSSTFRVILSIDEGDLISVNIGTDGNIEADTIKFGDYWFWEWAKLSNPIKVALLRKIGDSGLKGLKILGNSKEFNYQNFNGKKIPVRKVAQILLFFLGNIIYRNNIGGDALENTNPGITPFDSVVPGDDTYNPGDGMNPEDNPGSDACSISPDWPFKDCCIAHDYCYGANYYGCGECDRLKCDDDFLKCMLGIAGNNPALIEMAYIYYMAVRAFASCCFSYCSDAPSGSGGFSLGSLATGLIGIGIGTAVGLTAGGLLTGVAGVGLGIVSGTLVGGAIIAGLGKVYCTVCEEMVEWIEECEADRIRWEERCKQMKKKCKKQPWYKKILCKFKIFLKCTIIDTILKGLCWLLKKVIYPVVC